MSLSGDNFASAFTSLRDFNLARREPNRLLEKVVVLFEDISSKSAAKGAVQWDNLLREIKIYLDEEAGEAK